MMGGVLEEVEVADVHRGSEVPSSEVEGYKRKFLRLIKDGKFEGSVKETSERFEKWS